MQTEFQTRLLTQSDCYQAGRTIVPRGVMVHSTGVAQPDPEVFLRRWDRPGVDACVHAFVAEDRVIQTLPWNWRGWHAGRGERGSANDTHISFECCEPAGHTYQGGEMVGYDPAVQRPYFERIYQNAAALCARLCRMYGLDPREPGVVICHAEGHRLGIASGHGDVLQWWPKHGVTMDDFRRTVEDHMKGENDVTQEQFNAMMEEYLRQRRAQEPAGWSRTAREWAEASGLVAGDGAGEKGYRPLPPGRRRCRCSTACQRVKKRAQSNRAPPEHRSGGAFQLDRD